MTSLSAPTTANGQRSAARSPTVVLGIAYGVIASMMLWALIAIAIYLLA